MRSGKILVNGKEVELYNFDYQANQLRHEIRSIQSLNPFDSNASGARKQMFKSHISQRLVVNGATPKRILTGAEFEYAKAIFQTKVKNDSDIIRVIPYYRPMLGTSEIASNPETLVIFEDDTNTIDCLSITDYSSHHSYFGYKNKNMPAINNLHVGNTIPANTVLQTAPTINDDGIFMYGREMEVALMSHPAASEDGVVISESAAKALSFITLEKRVVEWGSQTYPINLYGDENNYRPHPAIGEYIHSSGKLMAFRKYDPDYSVVDMSKRQTTIVDEVFDNAVYVNGHMGRVVDIRVFHDPNQVSTTPEEMVLQTRIYDEARRQYYKEIIEVYHTVLKQRGNVLKMSPRFHRVVTDAIAIHLESQKVKASNGEKITHPQKLYRGSPMDDFRIEFTIMYEIVPTVGFKITGIQGDKGVIVHVVPDEDMPVNSTGTRADIIMDANATISRMNTSRSYEQFINAASRDLVLEFRRTLGLSNTDKLMKEIFVNEQNINNPTIQQCYQRLVHYYSIFNKDQEKLFRELNPKRQLEHLVDIINNGIYLYISGNQETEPVDMIRNVVKHFMPTRGPVTYRDYSGRVVTTKNPVLIGSMYIMLLEKTGDDWTAVSSGKFQNFGVLAKLTNKDKFSQPTRNQAIRAGGETEMRIFTSYCGPLFATEFLDRNSNMVTHREACESILSAKTPTNITRLIDRKKNPLGKSRPMQLVKHLAYCNGWEFKFKPYIEHEPVVDSLIVAKR